MQLRLLLASLLAVAVLGAPTFARAEQKQKGRTVIGANGQRVFIPAGARGVQGLDGHIVVVQRGQRYVQGLDRRVVPLNRGDRWQQGLDGHVRVTPGKR